MPTSDLVTALRDVWSAAPFLVVVILGVAIWFTTVPYLRNRTKNTESMAQIAASAANTAVSGLRSDLEAARRESAAARKETDAVREEARQDTAHLRWELAELRGEFERERDRGNGLEGTLHDLARHVVACPQADCPARELAEEFAPPKHRRIRRKPEEP